MTVEADPVVSSGAGPMKNPCPEYLLGRVRWNRRRFRYPCLLEAGHFERGEGAHVMHAIVGANLELRT